MGDFITPRHDEIFARHMTTLINNIGRPLVVHKKAGGSDCSWCIQDPYTRRSSGKPSPDYDWSTHPEYTGSNLTCPNCSGRGLVDTLVDYTIQKAIIQDVSGEEYERNKASYFKAGTKKVYGKLSEILTNTDDLNSDVYLEPYKSITTTIDNEEYRLANLNRLGLRELYLFEGLFVRADNMEA